MKKCIDFDKVAHLYVGCKVRYSGDGLIYPLNGVSNNGMLVGYDDKNYLVQEYGYHQPVLRKISSLTNEEEDMIAQIIMGDHDFIISSRTMGYEPRNIHESVRCLKVEKYCEHPSIKAFIPTNLIQIDFEDDDMLIINGRFEDAGNELGDDIIENPFELTRYLLSRHIDLFGLIKSTQAIDANTLEVNPYLTAIDGKQ